MKRGEIYYANLNPTLGSEINKTRPIVIISNNASNRVSSILTVLPITSNITKVYPFEVALPAKASGLNKDSKIQCHQIRTISKQRITTAAAGKVDKSIIQKITNAIKLHLDIV